MKRSVKSLKSVTIRLKLSCQRFSLLEYHFCSVCVSFLLNLLLSKTLKLTICTFPYRAINII